MQHSARRMRLSDHSYLPFSVGLGKSKDQVEGKIASRGWKPVCGFHFETQREERQLWELKGALRRRVGLALVFYFSCLARIQARMDSRALARSAARECWTSSG